MRHTDLAADWTPFRPASARLGQTRHARETRSLGQPASLPPNRRTAEKIGCQYQASLDRFQRCRDRAGRVAQSRSRTTRIGEDRLAQRDEVGSGADKIADRAKIMRITNARDVEVTAPDFYPASTFASTYNKLEIVKAALDI